MKKLLLGLLMLYCFNSIAQPSITWQKCLGGSVDDTAYNIQQTSDGGYIIIGRTYLSNDGDVSGNHGNNDVWVVKISSLGTLQWQKCLGGTGSDNGWSIMQTTDGGYILSCETQSNDGDVSGNHGGTFPLGGQDVWIVKLSSLGVIQWQKCLGGNLNESGRSIIQTVDGGYILIASTTSNNGDVSGNNGYTDGWVVKLSSQGVLQWQKCLGGPLNSDGFNSIQLTPEGGYILAGGASSNSGDVSGNHGGKDVWVVKLSSLGVLEWQKCFGGTQDESGLLIQLTTDGGYIFTGTTSSNNGDVSGNHGNNSDVWVVKISSLGVIQWQKCLGGTGSDNGWSILQTNDGEYIIVGSTSSNNGDVSGNHGNNSDAWVVKLSNSGVLEWQKCFGGTANDYGYSIQKTTDGEYIILGSTSSNNGDVSGNHGNNDVWVVKLSNTLEVSETSNDSIFTLYPNPVINLLNLNTDTNLINQPYTIVDGIGRVVINGKLNEVDTAINVEQLSKGIYFLKIAGNSATKFIKE